ncbi:cytochrome P450 3A41-like [Mya arenaria]|uniref:cytochrome P450 3A41-like n=1 Tax=Mya arenaria TaxID=6604 RepID=UPI0022E14E71|nr:cytochrome P450 3A41-like [Mya arenaria]
MSANVPCTRSWPLLGDLQYAMRYGVLENDIRSIRQHGPVHGSFIGTLPNLVIADPKFIREVLVRQFDKFPQRMQVLYISDWWNNSVVMSSGHHWRYMRAVISPAFNSTKLREMHIRMTSCLLEMDSFLSEKCELSQMYEVNMRTFFSALTLDILCNTSFGQNTNTLRHSDCDFTRHAKIVSTLNIESNVLNGLPMIIPVMKRLFRLLDLDYVDKHSLKYIKNVVGQMIDQRRSTDGTNTVKDTLQNLMDANNNNLEHDEHFENDNLKEYCLRKRIGLNNDELIANAIVVLMAGYDTTATTLTWMAYLLATNEDVQEKLIQSIDERVVNGDIDYDTVMKMEYIDWFLSETLRLYPAANRTGRDANEETNVCGVRIHKGMSITVPIYAIHRMPEYWDMPDECVPERFAPENIHRIKPYTYLPFGVGPRACLGIKMAQMLCKVIIVHILRSYTLHVCSKTEINPKLETSLLTKPVNGVILTIRPRKRTE